MTAPANPALRVGLVCPYSWDIPGGVQAHVRDLAEALIQLGHHVSVLAPGEEEAPGRPDYVVAAGKAVPIPYNGSIARLQFGVVSAARVRRWLRDGDFDVVHVHEPAPPSLSLLTCMIHDGPLVATFHSASGRSRILALSETFLQPFLEKLTGRIAVSEAARTMIVEHLGADAVVIPNGVAISQYANAEPLPGYPRAGGTIGFIGRFDEPRKGMDVLIGAVDLLAADRPQLRLLVAGRGDGEALQERLPRSLHDRVVLLGQVDEFDKAGLLRSVDVYCAPNIGGESFGIILLEALSAGTAVVASDLEAFRRVLSVGAHDSAGLLFETGSPRALAAALGAVLDDPALRRELTERGRRAVEPFDWSVVAQQVLMVYEVAIGEPVVVDAPGVGSEPGSGSGSESGEEESRLSRVLRTNRAVRAMRRTTGR